MFFRKLKNGASVRFNDTVDFSKYEDGIRHLLNTYVNAEDAKIINARFIRPIDVDTLKEVLDLNVPLFVYEEAYGGTLYHHILEFMANHDYHQKIQSMYVKDIIHHGSREWNQKDAKIDLDHLIEALKSKTTGEPPQ